MVNNLKLNKPFFILAPMDDVTDSVFRSVIASLASADLYFSEFVNVDGLNSPGRSRLLKKLYFTPAEKPLFAQLWGKDPENFYQIARQIADGTMADELGLPKPFNFSGVDLNMGCPKKQEVMSGTCSALINNRPLAKEIIEATKAGLAGKLPLSVKTRTGFNDVDFSWLEFLLNQSLFMLTVHGRTRLQQSKVPANWQHIKQARLLRDKLAPKTLIVGNGDVLNYSHGVKLATQSALDGIMIGRGIFNDPYAFSKDSPWLNMTKKKRLKLYLSHALLFQSTWKNNERPIYSLNKFCKVYVSGFNGAKELREVLMNQTDINSLINTLKELINN